jgi:hypothetical protein
MEAREGRNTSTLCGRTVRIRQITSTTVHIYQGMVPTYWLSRGGVVALGCVDREDGAVFEGKAADGTAGAAVTSGAAAVPNSTTGRGMLPP